MEEEKEGQSRKTEHIPVAPRSATINDNIKMLHELVKPNILPVACAVTLYWGFRVMKSFNKLLTNRYQDILFQLRRPDSLNNRMTAFRYLVVGGTVIPLFSIATIFITKKLITNNQNNTAPEDAIMAVPVNSPIRTRMNNFRINMGNRVEETFPERRLLFSQWSEFVRSMNSSFKRLANDPNVWSKSAVAQPIDSSMSIKTVYP